MHTHPPCIPAYTQTGTRTHDVLMLAGAQRIRDRANERSRQLLLFQLSCVFGWIADRTWITGLKSPRVRSKFKDKHQVWGKPACGSICSISVFDVEPKEKKQMLLFFLFFLLGSFITEWHRENECIKTVFHYSGFVIWKTYQLILC